MVIAMNCLTVYGAAARELGTKTGDCWGSVMELRWCTSEIVHFFINGEADIGSDCCRAITVITHNCWLAVLTSLGFTDHQVYILRGYCDAASAPSLA